MHSCLKQIKKCPILIQLLDHITKHMLQVLKMPSPMQAIVDLLYLNHLLPSASVWLGRGGGAGEAANTEKEAEETRRPILGRSLWGPNLTNQL